MAALYIVSTPIGNLEDISIRAIKTLLSADYIACEDTRRTGLLLQELQKRYPHFGSVKKEQRLLRYDDRTEQNAAAEILELLASGKSVALVSDAGTPLISDPGYILVREARRQGIQVVSIPGASALLTALTSSGLPANTFTFVGYPPEKQGPRLKLFQSFAQVAKIFKQNRTYILYCAPHKLAVELSDLKTALGDREIVVARELTKVHEEIWQGAITQALKHFENPQGEFILLLTITS